MCCLYTALVHPFAKLDQGLQRHPQQRDSLSVSWIDFRSHTWSNVFCRTFNIDAPEPCERRGLAALYQARLVARLVARSRRLNLCQQLGIEPGIWTYFCHVEGAITAAGEALAGEDARPTREQKKIRPRRVLPEGR